MAAVAPAPIQGSLESVRVSPVERGDKLDREEWSRMGASTSGTTVKLGFRSCLSLPLPDFIAGVVLYDGL